MAVTLCVQIAPWESRGAGTEVGEARGSRPAWALHRGWHTTCLGNDVRPEPGPSLARISSAAAFPQREPAVLALSWSPQFRPIECLTARPAGRAASRPVRAYRGRAEH